MNGGAALSAFGMGMLVPILPAYAAQLGGTPTLIGILLASFAASRLVIGLPAAWLADRIGHRAVLLIATGATAPAAALCAIVNGFWWLALFCVAEGILAGAFATVGTAAVALAPDAARRGRSLAAFQSATLAGASLGPGAGGFAAQQFGLRAPFLLYALLAGLTAVWLYARLAGVSWETVKRPRGRAIKSTWQTLRSRPLLPLWLLTFALTFARAGTQLVALPFLGARRLDLNAGEIGLALTLSGLLSLSMFYPAGWVADRYGRKAAIVPGGIGVTAGLAVLATATNPVAYLAAVVLLGIGAGLTAPGPAAHLADALPATTRTMGVGIYRTFGDSAAVVAPLSLGWANARDVEGVSLLLAAGFVLVAVTGFGWLAATPNST